MNFGKKLEILLHMTINKEKSHTKRVSQLGTDNDHMHVTIQSAHYMLWSNIPQVEPHCPMVHSSFCP